MERYYQPEIECASREQIKAWQDERLVKQVQHVWEHMPYYRKKMEAKGLTPADIKGVWTTCINCPSSPRTTCGRHTPMAFWPSP